MVRNRNGYWMDPRFMSPDDGGAGGADPGAGNGTPADDGKSGDGNPAESGQNGDNSGEKEGQDALKAEIARLQNEMAKQKSALDAATSEAGKYKKELRAKQTAEEIAAEEKKAADEQAAKEIEELRREVARTKTVKNVMSKLGTDEETSAKIAEYLYGAEDPENALAVIQQAWTVKEKALRMEFGKIPAPGSGGSTPEELAEQENIRRAQNLGKQRAEQNETAKKAIDAYMR